MKKIRGGEKKKMMKRKIALLITVIILLSITTSALSLPVGANMCAAEENKSSLQTAAMPAEGSAGTSTEGKVSSMKVALGKDQSVADVDVLSSDSGGTILDIDVQSIQEEEITVNNEVFQILTISGNDYTYEVGKPQMPVIRETISIPDGASVQATIIDASYSTYKGYNVYPVQPPEVDLKNNSEFVIDEEFYSQDAFYPEELVGVGTPGIWRDLSVVGLQVNPVMFNPATGELRVYDRIKIKLEYYDALPVTKTIEPKFARMYESVILNYDFLDIVIEAGTIPPQDSVRLDDEPCDQVTMREDKGAVDVGVLSSDSRGTIISISNVEVEEEEITVNGKMFQILTIPGYDYTYEVGKPQMPVIRETIGIPDGASVQATILGASYSTYKGYNVYPVQPPEVDLKNNSEFVIDEEFYSQDVFYPEEVVELGTPSIWRDLTVVSVQVNPVMFNPATGELRIYDRIKLELEYYDGVTETKTIEPQFAEMYRNAILNYDFLDIVIAGGEGTTSSQEDFRLDAPADQTVKYLSIRHEDHSSFETIRPLLDYHASQGLPYESWCVTSGSSKTDQEIKDLIVDTYTAYPELEYVLLVGDISFLPWNASWDGVPGDYWYACVDGDDLYPELAVGRLSTNNDAEITQQVNKILTYLQSPPSGSWVDKALLVANYEDAPGKYQECKEDIRTAVYTDPFIFDTAYGASFANGGDEATNADVTSAINAGRGIVNYRGHGSETSWWNWNIFHQDYTTTDAHALANGDITPVVFSIACTCAALDYASECLAEAFVKDDDSAVAFLGASRPSYTVPNHEFDKSLFYATGNLNIDNIGWVSNYANTVLIDKYGPTHTYMDNVKMYLWLGDPALEFATGAGVTLYYPDFTDTNNPSSWRSWFVIQNPRASTANIDIELRSRSGTLLYSGSSTIPAHGASAIRPRNLVGSDCAGTAIISSDQQIMGTCQINRNNNDMCMSYTAFSEGSSTLYYPDFTDTISWRSWFVIQNPSASIANIDIELRSRSGTLLYSGSSTIPAHGASAIRPRNLVGSECAGTAIISSDQQIMGTCQINRNNNDMCMSYTAFSEGSSTLYYPDFTDTISWSSWFVIQNPSASIANIDIELRSRSGTLLYSGSSTIPAHGAGGFSLLGLDCAGTAIISSDQQIMGTCQINRNDNDMCMSYTAFSEGSSTLYYPDFTDTNNPSSWRSWFVIQNPSASTANIDIVLRSRSGTLLYSGSSTIPAHGASAIRPRNLVGSDCAGTAIISSDQQIMGTCQINRNNNDMCMSYRALLQ
jgi:hypothetical protein